MRIATWNINGMRARIEYLCRWLADIEPDVVGLQELKMQDRYFPQERLRDLGYHAVCHGQKSWNGVAVLSREPAQVTQRGLPGQDELGARLLSTSVAGLSFTTVYCPNGKYLDHPDFQGKLAWYDALIAHMTQVHQAGQPVVLCGDFNIVPAGLDSWNEDAFAGGIFHSEDERGRLGRLLSWGFVDLFRAQNPNDPGFSWWDYRGGAFAKREGLRIDLLLGTASVAERARSATVDRRWRKKLDGLIASDHAPVWVDLE